MAGDDYYAVFQNSLLGGISRQGRYVTFATTSSNLVPGDTNRSWDVFLRDRRTETTRRVSVASDGTQANEDSFDPAMSADGSVIAFTSGASNLVRGDTNGSPDVFVHYVETGRTVRISLTRAEGEARSPRGTPSYDGSDSPAISSDGKRVAFSSVAENLVPNDTNGLRDVFVRDIPAHTTHRVSVSSEGEQPQPLELQGETYGGSGSPSISGDGKVVMFTSMAANLVPGDTNDLPDTFVHELPTGLTERVSVTSDGVQVTGCTDDECLHEEGSSGGSLSFDGRLAAFTSGGALAAGDDDHPHGTHHDVFLRDRLGDRTLLVARRRNGAPARPGNLYGPSLSITGRWLVFAADDRTIVARTRGVEAFGWVFLQELPPALFD